MMEARWRDGRDDGGEMREMMEARWRDERDDGG